MPDGGMRDNYAAVRIMHERLVEYGLCWIRGGKGKTEQIVVVKDANGVRKEIIIRPDWDSDVKPPPREWARVEIERAGKLHSLILKLPLQHSIVVQVFYGEEVAQCWDAVRLDARPQILRDLTHWNKRPKGVNPRIADANLARHTNAPGIYHGKFMDIRDEALRMLLNLQRRHEPQDVAFQQQQKPIYSRIPLRSEDDAL